MNETPKFGLKEAMQYYDQHDLQGEQAMKIDAMPDDVIGLTRDNEGDVVPLLRPARQWNVASTGELPTHASPDLIVIDETGPQMVIQNRSRKSGAR